MAMRKAGIQTPEASVAEWKSACPAPVQASAEAPAIAASDRHERMCQRRTRMTATAEC